jgi:cytochrome P450
MRFDESLNAYTVSTYDLAQEVLRGRGWSSTIQDNLGLGEPDLVPPLLTRMLLFMDPPGHTRLRSLVAPSFATRRMAALRPRIATIVDAALDGVGGLDEFDVLTDLAYPIPVAVIAELLDVGTEGAHLIRAETPRLVSIVELAPTEERLLEAADASLSVSMFLLPLLAERRKNPGADFLSALLTVEVAGERLDLDEVLATVLLLLLAGHETTANLIASGTLDLITNPDQLDLLRRRPELLPSAIEEILRLDPPARLVGRTATVDHRLAGQEVLAGQRVLVDLAAANRDPVRFADPDRFDIERAATSHLAFGAGPHFCVGAALARVEAEEALRRLFSRYPRLVATGEPSWRASTTFHALEALPVRAG